MFIGVSLFGSNSLRQVLCQNQIQAQNQWNLRKRGEYREFPPDKKYLAPEHYLHRASPHSPIRSSIPAAVLESQDQAVKARKTVQTLATFGAAGLLALGVTTWSLIQDSWRLVDDVRYQLYDIGRELNRASKLDELQSRIQSIDKRMIDAITKLQQRLHQVNAKVDGGRSSTTPLKQQEQNSQPRQPSSR
ncbi:MAG: hypothetical protein C4293_19160 [Nitrospiraceae bacterium]